jgi:hypothetical protein
MADEFQNIQVEPQQDGRIRVGEYMVDPDSLTCGCKDNQYRGHLAPCKHLFRYFLALYDQNHLTEIDDMENDAL